VRYYFCFIRLSCYASLKNIKHGLNRHGSCRPLDIPILSSKILHCIDAISNWTASNRLGLNPDKTEFMWCAAGRMQHHCDMSTFVLGDVQIDPQSKIDLLVVILDSDLSMSSQVNRARSTCFYQLRRLKSIRRSLPDMAAKTLITALVGL